MRRPFREHNPIPIGAAGMVALTLVLIAAFNAGSLPFLGGGRTFHAHFSEAAGLKVRDQVRIAGVKVGQVDAIELEGTHVDVAFTLDEGVELGTRTRAAIKIATVLGQKYVSLAPEGKQGLGSGGTIPLSATRAPYDVTEAFSGLTRRVEDLDEDRLAKAFDTLSATFANSAPEVRSTLRGLTRLSETIASRNDQLQELLGHAEGVSGVLAERDRAFAVLLEDGNKLLREVRQRRAVIHQLLLNTVQLSDQLTALVRENEKQLGPTLRRLNKVVDVLRRHQKDLARSIELLAPFVQEFTDTLGSGRWFDVYLQNVVPLPITVRPPGGK